MVTKIQTLLRKGVHCIKAVQQRAKAQIQKVKATVKTIQEKHMSDVDTILGKVVSNGISVIMNTFVIYALFIFAINMYSQDYMEMVNGVPTLYTVDILGKTQIVAHPVVYFIYILIATPLLGFMEYKTKKIGKYTYNKKAIKKSIAMTSFTTFAKISTLDTIFKIFVDIFSTAIKNIAYIDIIKNIAYLIVLFVGLYLIFTLNNFLFGEDIKGKNGTKWEIISKLFVNYTSAILSFCISFHKVLGFGFFNETFFNFALAIFVYFYIDYWFEKTKNKFEFANAKIDKELKKNTKKAKADAAMNIAKMNRNTKRLNVFASYKIAMSNLYYFIIGIIPTVIGFSNSPLWYANNEVILVMYIAIYVIKAVVEVVIEVLKNNHKYKR